MRSLHASLIAAGLLLAARPGVGAVGAASPAVVIVTPAPGSELIAGSHAILEWRPEPGAPQPLGDEWEAFLSLDGGRSYRIRITPHLDRTLRQVVWTVPEAPSRDVRILLRFGDEHRETTLELPQALTILPGPAQAAPLALALTPGEAARPGEAGVVVWDEGSRQGNGRHRAMALTASLRQGFAGWPLAGSALPVATHRRGRSSVELTSRPSFSAAPPVIERVPCGRPATQAVDRLLQTARRNE